MNKYDGKSYFIDTSADFRRNHPFLPDYTLQKIEFTVYDETLKTDRPATLPFSVVRTIWEIQENSPNCPSSYVFRVTKTGSGIHTKYEVSKLDDSANNIKLDVPIIKRNTISAIMELDVNE